MVIIMENGTTPERNEFGEAPGEVITRVGLDSLVQAEQEPDPQAEQVTGQQHRPHQGTQAKHQGLHWVGVLCCYADGGCIIITLDVFHFISFYLNEKR